MELRQCWLSSSRIAEISVPAWPIPIHHTKFVIAKPHITGTRMPQMPTPLANSTATDSRNRNSSPSPTVTPGKPEQRRLLGQHDRGDLVGDACRRYSPGAMISRGCRFFDYLCVHLPWLRLSLDLRVRIAQLAR